MRHTLRCVLLAALVGVAPAAHAQLAGETGAEPTQDGPVLHEYVAPPPSSAGAAAESGKGGPKTIGGTPQAGRNPAAVRSGDKLVPEPPKTQPPQRGEPVHGTQDFGADRETQARPDYATGADSTLHYTEVFNPAVLPFKRMSALDGVRDNYFLHVYDGNLTALPVGGPTQPDRDLFWASLLIDLAPGQDVPIPSTSPDMRILSY